MTSTSTKETTLTFWEEWQDAESDPERWLYLTAVQKLAMLDSGNPFDVTSVTEGRGRYGLEWDVTIAAGDTVKAMSFAAGYEARDHKLKAMQAWLADRPFGAIRCRLVMHGRMFDLADGRDGSEEPEPVEFIDWTAEQVTA